MIENTGLQTPWQSQPGDRTDILDLMDDEVWSISFPMCCELSGSNCKFSVDYACVVDLQEFKVFCKLNRF